MIRKILDPAEYKHNMTVGDLRKVIEGLPDDGKVMVQRVEDMYFEQHNWAVYEKQQEVGMLTHENQYHPAWCAIRYPDEPHLFLDLHY